METYVKRTYQQRALKAKRVATENTENYPFWDYRSRRGSCSTSGASSSTSSGCSSFDGSSISSLSSIRGADNVSIDSGSLGSDSDSVMLPSDPYRLQLHFLVDPREVLPLAKLYQPVLNMIDQDLHIFNVIANTDDETVNQSFCHPKPVSRMPSVAMMIFLSEEGPLGYERVQTAKRRFEKSPWRFHHSEHVGQGKINLYPYNSSDYFYTSEELPLWAVRMVHCGKESLRIVLFTSEESWDDMLQFYKLIIGFEPDMKRDDFCMFTIHSREHYDVQFALKKLKGETLPRPLQSVKLQFKVPDVGSLVPLFPNVCKPISDNLWETKDHDGNVITIDVVGKHRAKSSTPTESTVMTLRARSSSRSSRSSGDSVISDKSVQSFTSVTSSSLSSSVASEKSLSLSDVITPEIEDRPPALPPRVPLKKAPVDPPCVPERPKQLLAGLKGFYV